MKVKPKKLEPVSYVKLIPGIGALLEMEYDLEDEIIYWNITESGKETEGAFTPTFESVDIKTPDGWTVELTPDDWKDIVKE